MKRFRVFCAALMAALAAACGDDPGPEARAAGSGGGGAPSSCGAGERLVEGKCVPAGIHDDGCLAGELGVEGGGCRPAGIPMEGCAPGFAPEAMGCAAVLPAEPCPGGTMAIPGETRCRPVASCGAAPWGDIAIEPNTVFVDAAYTGADSDGSANKPWTTIQVGVDAAPAGALVAVAEGTYAEEVVIAYKPVRLWGRCPSLVEIEGSADGFAAVYVAMDASGSEIASIGVRGGALGIFVTGSQDIRVDRVWIHDTADRPLNAQDDFGPTRVAVTDTLIEQAGGSGAIFFGAEGTIERSVIRRPQPALDPTAGWGVNVQAAVDTGQRSNVGIRSSVVEDNRGVGVFVEGSDATIEASVIRGTAPASSVAFGRGVSVEPNAVTGRSNVTVRSTVVDDNQQFGVLVVASDAILEGTVVRGTQPQESDLEFGWGVGVFDHPDSGEHASVGILSSLIESNHHAGVVVVGSEATIDATVLRGTLPRASDQKGGGGIAVQPDPETKERSNVVVRSSLVDANHDVGIFVAASDVKIEATRVQNTAPQASDQRAGRGIHVQIDPETGAGASAEIRTSVVEHSLDFGISIAGAQATIDATLVRTTLPRAADGLFGDSLTAAWASQPASVVVTTSRIEGGARAGVSTFGSSVTLGDSALLCNAIDLDGEPHAGVPHAFDDAGGNACGCDGATVECQLVSASLAPPDPIQP